MEKICPACGHIGRPKTKAQGTLLGELAIWILMLVVCAATGLWLLLVIPLIYSLWRLVAKRERVCRVCGSPGMIPLYTPRGRQLAEQYHDDDQPE